MYMNVQCTIVQVYLHVCRVCKYLIFVGGECFSSVADTHLAMDLNSAFMISATKEFSVFEHEYWRENKCLKARITWN